MSNLIDLRTVILMATGLSGFMGLVLVLLERSTPEAVPGLKHWARATWLALITSGLFGLRDLLPTFFSMTVANGVLLVALLVYMQGTHLYLGRTMRWRAWWVLVAVSMLGFVWYAEVNPSFRGRMIWVVGSMGLIMAAHTRLFWQATRTSVGTRFTTATLGFMSLVFLARWAHAVLVDQGDDQLYSPSGVQMAYMASYTFVLLMASVGFALLASERMREAFEHQATHDALTNVLNRRALLERLQQEMARCKRYKTLCAVLMLDLDHFKRVNDRHGHQVGDEVLKAFVRRVGQALRPNDLLGRLGGEEFLIVLPHTDGPSAQATAQRILRAVAQPDGALPVCTVSIGLAAWTPQDESALDLMARADKAMYAAKANGRNRVQVA
jgi:diguanylate cyclase (GGDEF)-like protein